MHKLTGFKARLFFKGEEACYTTFECENDFDKEEPKVRIKATRWANKQAKELFVTRDLHPFSLHWKNWDSWEGGQLVRRQNWNSLEIRITAIWIEDEQPQPAPTTEEQQPMTLDRAHEIIHMDNIALTPDCRPSEEEFAEASKVIAESQTNLTVTLHGTVDRAWQQDNMPDYICIKVANNFIQPMNPEDGIAATLEEGDAVVLETQATALHLRSDGELENGEQDWKRTEVDLNDLPDYWTAKNGEKIGHYIQIDGEVKIWKYNVDEAEEPDWNDTVEPNQLTSMDDDSIDYTDNSHHAGN